MVQWHLAHAVTHLLAHLVKSTQTSAPPAPVTSSPSSAPSAWSTPWWNVLPSFADHSQHWDWRWWETDAGSPLSCGSQCVLTGSSFLLSSTSSFLFQMLVDLTSKDFRLNTRCRCNSCTESSTSSHNCMESNTMINHYCMPLAEFLHFFSIPHSCKYHPVLYCFKIIKFYSIFIKAI